MNIHTDDHTVTETLESLQFSDLFNIEDIQRIQNLFSDATGVASIITLPDGSPYNRTQ